MNAKGFGLMFAIILLLVLAACGNDTNGNDEQQGNNNDQSEEPQGDTIVQVTDENVRFLGRYYEKDGAYYFNWTNAGFEFTFEGTRVDAEFVTDSPDDENRRVEVYVFVDGKDNPEDGKLIRFDAARKTYELASGLEPGVHTIKVIKRSANVHGGNFMVENIAPTAGVTTLNLHGGKLLPPPPAKERKLEFIGDSITVGAEVVFQEREDGWRTYAAYAARELDADIQVQAISGNGVISSILGGPLFDLPKEFPYTDKYHLGPVPWDFSKYQSDVVVINLGTNDVAGVGPGKMFTVQEFEDAYLDFIMEIRSKYPRVKVIGALGAMSDTLFPQVENAVKRANEQAGETFAYSLKFEKFVKRADTGGHPDAAKHIEDGKVLVELIREITGWE